MIGIFSLAAIRQICCLFTVAGHINYAKSTRVFLQNMIERLEKFPWVYEHYSSSGLYTVRSNKLRTGLWSDLTMEQVLTRSLNSQGGIDRGRGIIESV